MHSNDPRRPINSLMTDKLVWLLAGIIAAISSGHYLLSTDYAIIHTILQRLYYIPIMWAAYKYGRTGGLTVSLISGLLYLPHILLEWQGHPEYRASLFIEIALFLIVGTAAGMLFEQKAASQRILLSYEKMALFGSLSRTIIRSLKIPLRSIRGMLLMLQPVSRQDKSITFCTEVIDKEIATIERVREDLIALVSRKRLRLKKRNLNETMFHFMSQVETGLNFKGIRVKKLAKDIHLDVHINRAALVSTLHILFGFMLDTERDIVEMTIYTNESASNVWLGASVDGILMDPYNRSDLSVINTQQHHEYELISVLNTMNDHYGDVRFRWCEKRLVEFLLVFPKNLKLPWQLKDEAHMNDIFTKPIGQNQRKRPAKTIKEEV